MDNESEVIRQENEPDMIRQQMEETRTSLQSKLETLENQVVNTVQDSVTAVTDTVESVKAAVQDTVDSVKDTFQETVDTVKDTVQGTVDSMQETVETVKEHLDIRQYVEEYPWAMFLGSAAVGYVGGCLLRGTPAPSRSALPPGPVFQGEPMARETPRQRFVDENRVSSAPRHAEQPKESWFNSLNDLFGNEMTKLKGLAIGTALGIVRDMVASSTPPPVAKELAEVIDNFTVKLGGEPIHAAFLTDLAQGITAKPAAEHGKHDPWGAETSRVAASQGSPVSAPSWRP